MNARAFAYRPDIDGLRTVAVVPVVLFHAGLFLFPGGFVGVDIFFVISGYLITGILLKDINRGEFSIARFYQRRIKRIFPAFLVVCGVTTALAAAIFPPDLLDAYSKSAASAILFVSNFYFWKSVDYFTTNTHVEPLLHTWSLAVEEQFYIFYPWLLYFAHRLGLSLRLVIAALFCGSLVMAVALYSKAPSATFYLLPPRAWELAIGGLLALNWIAPPARRQSAAIAGFVGAALIAFAIFAYDRTTPFPGLTALPPTLGAALIIWSGSGTGSPISTALSTRPMVLIGRASYSLYLWHVPLLAFVAYLYGGTLPLSAGLMVAALSLGLALITLRLVEDPVRHSVSPLAVGIPSALMVGLLGLSLLTLQQAGLPGRFSRETWLVLDSDRNRGRHPVQCMSKGDQIVRPKDACQLGSKDVRPTALLWGDSHAIVTATAMDKSAREAGRSFLFAATADCPPGLGFSISTNFAPALTTAPSYRFCHDYNQQMLEVALAHPEITTIVISARWTNWRIGEPANPAEASVDIRLAHDGVDAASGKDNREVFKQGFFALLDRLHEAGKTVYLVGPVPEPTFDVPQRLYIARFGLMDKPQALSTAGFEHRHHLALEILGEAVNQHHAQIIRPETVLCANGSCPLTVKGVPVFFDHNHLSYDAAISTSHLYDPLFQHAASSTTIAAASVPAP